MEDRLKEIKDLQVPGEEELSKMGEPDMSEPDKDLFNCQCINKRDRRLLISALVSLKSEWSGTIERTKDLDFEDKQIFADFEDRVIRHINDVINKVEKVPDC